MKETDRDKNKREISIKKIQSLDGNDSKMLHLSSLPFAYENIYIFCCCFVKGLSLELK